LRVANLHAGDEPEGPVIGARVSLSFSTLPPRRPHPRPAHSRPARRAGNATHRCLEAHGNILVVDDELGIRALLSEILTDEGHTVELAENAAQARAGARALRPDLVLLDIWMPDVDGVTLLKEWSATGHAEMPVIMMSGHGTIDTAVEATKYGASAFLEKPITLQKLLRAVEQALVKPASAAQPWAACARPAQRQAWHGPTGPLHNAHAPRHSALQPPLPSTARRPSRASTWTARCAKRATPSRRATSSSTWPRKAARMTRVAEKTGLERTHLYRKLKQLGVDLSRNKRG
jgi:DNA-binding NtrC family response regulator